MTFTGMNLYLIPPPIRKNKLGYSNDSIESILFKCWNKLCQELWQTFKYKTTNHLKNKKSTKRRKCHNEKNSLKSVTKKRPQRKRGELIYVQTVTINQASAGKCLHISTCRNSQPVPILAHFITFIKPCSHLEIQRLDLQKC